MKSNKKYKTKLKDLKEVDLSKIFGGDDGGDDDFTKTWRSMQEGWIDDSPDAVSNPGG